MWYSTRNRVLVSAPSRILALSPVAAVSGRFPGSFSCCANELERPVLERACRGDIHAAERRHGLPVRPEMAHSYDTFKRSPSCTNDQRAIPPPAMSALAAMVARMSVRRSPNISGSVFSRSVSCGMAIRVTHYRVTGRSRLSAHPGLALHAVEIDGPLRKEPGPALQP